MKEKETQHKQHEIQKCLFLNAQKKKEKRTPDASPLIILSRLRRLRTNAASATHNFKHPYNNFEYSMNNNTTF